ncbi:MAG: hypothetical protein AB1589_23110 [Cyanobacteriota bacterium]
MRSNLEWRKLGFLVTPTQIAALFDMITRKEITIAAAKQVLSELFEDGRRINDKI